MYGGAGDDVIRVTSLDVSNSIESIDGKGGVNVLSGSSGGNKIDLSGISVCGIDRIEGNGGADTITGTSGSDIIYGGSRDAVEDFASDILKGGSGSDEYHVGIGDIVSDSDNAGAILVGDRNISGMTFTRLGQSSFYMNKDSGAYVSLDQYTGILSVFLSSSPSFFFIEDFSSGDFGITLKEDELPTTSKNINGNSLNNYASDPFHNILDVSCKVDAGDGQDMVLGSRKDDILYGGEGDDVLIIADENIFMEEFFEAA